MKVEVSVTNREYLKFEFSNMEHIPLIGEDIHIESHGSYYAVTVTKRQLNINMFCEQTMYIDAIENL